MPDSAQSKVSTGSYRWKICALLFFATTLIYFDRSILNILAPTLEKTLGWTKVEYGYITMCFTGLYAIGLASFGWFIDRYGTKIGYAVTIAAWSVVAMCHSLVGSVLGFGIVRSLLGLSESGNFPAAIKGTAEWFPKKERALATGIFNSGANVGAVIAPAIVPWLTITYGWATSFVAVGAVGILWLVLWMVIYKKPEDEKKLSKSEYDYILSDNEPVVKERVPWRKLLKYRQTWAFVLGKFFTDPIWWFYLYWLGLYLSNNFHVNLKELGLPLIVIYSMTTVGSIGGGWLSGWFISKGMDVNKGRRLTMLIFACLVVPVVCAANLKSMWLAVVIIGVAAAAHQGWSANIFTTVSDMFPKKAVGSVTGIGGLAGSLGAMFFSLSAGYIVTYTGSYTPLFIICGSAYLLAFGVMTLLTWNAKPVDI
jgi:MFS transporter, ACS family, hexuronate transporter